MLCLSVLSALVVLSGTHCYLMKSLISKTFRSSKNLLLQKRSIVRNQSPFLEESSPSASQPSHLFANEVASFGICTALAEEHARIGNFKEAEKLAEEAIKLGVHL